MPASASQQMDTARKTYHRFGQFSAALDRIRACIERQPMEKHELQRMCRDLGIPGDFDAAQINWRPDYDEFFYRQLARRARRVYLFQEEYLFELEHGVVVETPQLGHATYLFARPDSIEEFLAVYACVTKDDLRQNRANAAEKLRFLGRVIHGTNPRQWVKSLKSRLGEALDFAEAIQL